jgi:putative membrane protein
VDTASVWSEWNWEPSILVGLALFAGLYLYATGPGRRWFTRAAPVRPGQKAWFLGGVVVLFLALLSPLDALSDRYLFSAHMWQHFMLAFLAPPCLLLGTPDWLLRPLLKQPILAWGLRHLTAPLFAYASFNIIFMAWHLPALYEATLHNEALHIFEHLLFIATGVLNWWPVMSPLPELQRLSYPGRIFYLFLEVIPTSVMGAFVTFPATVLYPTYANAPRVLDLSPMEDQQFAGLVMWIPAAFIYLFALSLVFMSWFSREQKAESVHPVPPPGA